MITFSILASFCLRKGDCLVLWCNKWKFKFIWFLISRNATRNFWFWSNSPLVIYSLVDGLFVGLYGRLPTQTDTCLCPYLQTFLHNCIRLWMVSWWTIDFGWKPLVRQQRFVTSPWISSQGNHILPCRFWNLNEKERGSAWALSNYKVNEPSWTDLQLSFRSKRVINMCTTFLAFPFCKFSL